MLAACEYSGVVRDAFSLSGWDAWSCDIIPTESELTKQEGKHYQCDVFDVLYRDWDLLIAFPPCTYLTYAGTANWLDEGRVMKRIEGAKFFMQLWEAPIPHICIENPRGIMTGIFRTPDMEIHPWYFGDKEMKRTCIWLKNLPLLKYQLENDLFSERTATDKPEPIAIEVRRSTGIIKKRYFNDYVFGNYLSDQRSHLRSRFWPGIARAMAEQWTDYIKNKKSCKE